MSIPNHLMERLLSITGTPEDRDALVAAITAGGGGSSGANTTLSNLVGPTVINTSLIPNTDASKDLGAVNQTWRKFFAFVWKDSADNSAIVIDTTTRQLKNLASNTVLDFSGANLSINLNKIVDVGNPVDPQDVATKDYVDSQLSGGASGSFTSQDGKTVTVVNGLITAIV